MSGNKSIIIIGGGIAGLSAGCYAQMNGYRSQIFELHDLPGGLCTAWERKGYVFDGCIHYLFGSGEGQPFNTMWQELGAVQGREFVNHEAYQQVTDGENTLIVYANPDRLQAHMTELSPDDAELIRAFCDGVRRFASFDMSAMYKVPKPLMGPLDWREFGGKMLPFIPALAKWALQSTRDFANKFRDPFMRKAVAQMFSWHEMGVKHYCFDPSLAPAGKSVIELIVRTNYAYWQRIYGRRIYDTEQTQVSDIIIDHLEKRYPGIRADIEFVDEATPLSYERYTGNWMGATTGWLLTKETIPMMINGVPKTLPNLEDFYMAGHWVEPGGTVTLAAASGKNVIQMICAEDGNAFTTTLP